MKNEHMEYTVDVTSTSVYKAKYNEPCNCIYCKNFRQAFQTECPDAVKKLNEMGLQLNAALEVIDCFWDSHKNKRIYEAFFSVQGQLAKDGLIIYDNDAIITLHSPDSPNLIYNNTGMKSPYFIVTVETALPWLIDEQPEK